MEHACSDGYHRLTRLTATHIFRRCQNCSLVSCPHNGCHEAKLLHLHIKTCAAGAGFDCPSKYPGCDKARKLLAHYHRCRTSRARQAGQIPTRRDSSQQQCLVCSLVARQARTMLERNSVIRLSNSSSTGRTNSKKPASPSAISLDVPTKVIGAPIDSPNSSEEFMPPPPPRRVQNQTKGPRGETDSGLSNTVSRDDFKHKQFSWKWAGQTKCTPLMQPDAAIESFESADAQRLKGRQSSFLRGRDRSLSVSKETSNGKVTGLNLLSSGLQRRRRSASVGCMPHVSLSQCSTIDEDEVLLERLDHPS